MPDNNTKLYWQEHRDRFNGVLKELSLPESRLEYFNEAVENKRGLMLGGEEALLSGIQLIACDIDDVGIENVKVAKKFTESAIDVVDVGEYLGYTQEIGLYNNLSNLEIEKWLLCEEHDEVVIENIMNNLSVMWKNEEMNPSLDIASKQVLLMTYVIKPIVYDRFDIAKSYFTGFMEKISYKNNVKQSGCRNLLDLFIRLFNNFFGLGTGEQSLAEQLNKINFCLTGWGDVTDDVRYELCEEFTFIEHVNIARLTNAILQKERNPIETVKSIRGF